MDRLVGTYAASGSKPIDMEKLKEIFSQIPEPTGLVFLPSGGKFDVYRFPLKILEHALKLATYVAAAEHVSDAPQTSLNFAKGGSPEGSPKPGQAPASPLA